MNNFANQQSKIFGRRFPLGYLLHGHPVHSYTRHHYDASSSCCGQFLLSTVLLGNMYRSYRSYMKTDPTGLTIYWHPGYEIRLSWQEVLRFEKKKYFGMLPYEMLYVDKPIYPQEVKVIYLTKNIKEYVEKQRLGIPLRCYQGWPHGDLAQELRKYIPEIMNHPGVPEWQVRSD